MIASWLTVTEAGRLYIDRAHDALEAAQNAELAFQCQAPYLLNVALPSSAFPPPSEEGGAWAPPVYMGTVTVDPEKTRIHGFVAIRVGARARVVSFLTAHDGRAWVGAEGYVLALPFDVRVPPLAGQVMRRASGATCDVEAARGLVHDLLALSRR